MISASIHMCVGVGVLGVLLFGCRADSQRSHREMVLAPKETGRQQTGRADPQTPEPPSIAAQADVSRIGPAAELVEAWQKDWRAFAAEISAISPRSPISTAEVSRYFEGEPVEWTGSIDDIEPAQSYPGVVHLSMEPTVVSISGLRLTIDTLALYPTEAQWDQWSSVEFGEDVVFRTRLRGVGAITVGDRTSEIYLVILSTEGAEVVSVAGENTTLEPRRQRRHRRDRLSIGMTKDAAVKLVGPPDDWMRSLRPETNTLEHTWEYGGKRYPHPFSLVFDHAGRLKAIRKHAD